jgi:hypothetical protein
MDVQEEREFMELYGSYSNALVVANSAPNPSGGPAPPPAVVAPAVAAVAPPPRAAPRARQQRNSMRWTSVTSSFILRRFCELISTGVRTDKGFKEVHLNKVARDLQEFTGNNVTSTQVYNHLRTWRKKWIRVTKLRELSGALWDEETFMISLEDEHYNGHVKVLAIVHIIFTFFS